MLTPSPGEGDGNRASQPGQDVHDIEPHSIGPTIEPTTEEPAALGQRARPDSEPVADCFVVPGTSRERDRQVGIQAHGDATANRRARPGVECEPTLVVDEHAEMTRHQHDVPSVAAASLLHARHGDSEFLWYVVTDDRPITSSAATAASKPGTTNPGRPVASATNITAASGTR